MKLMVILASSFLIGVPAMAQEAAASGEQPAASSTANAASQNNPEQRKICRRIEGGTGSRLDTRRVCLTSREWREYERNN